MELLISKLFLIILIFHILCGSISLFAALGAMLCTKGQHNHRLFGKIFFYSMTGVFITAIPLSLIKQNLFLFLIAIFSYYLALSGWRYAKNRKGSAIKLDWIFGILMLITSIIMIYNGLTHVTNNKGIILILFGMIAAIFSISDIKAYLNHSSIGKKRITNHFSAMLGATIAALTAFSVTNMHIKPEIILWLGPTVIITPIIIWWKNKIAKDKNF